ncbi:MAG: DapH/DapD/GlmU-related protein [Candidatus Omnitrophica bacterium]|nr:DapH/DapD/GlmU-related protein [Candidatus Omnitrophota bacterium]
MKSSNAKLYEGVSFGKNCAFGEYTVIGVPPAAIKKGEKCLTKIGDDAKIRSHTVVYAGNTIGNNFQTGHQASIREHNTIGHNVSIGTGSVVEHHITIEDNVRIHSNAFICEYSRLEKGSWVGPCVVFTNALHPLCPKGKDCLRGPTLKRGAKIGANTTLLPGVVIGENALIGAGSVVVKDVPANKVVTGNPARVIKDISELKCPYDLVLKPY